MFPSQKLEKEKLSIRVSFPKSFFLLWKEEAKGWFAAQREEEKKSESMKASNNLICPSYKRKKTCFSVAIKKS